VLHPTLAKGRPTGGSGSQEKGRDARPTPLRISPLRPHQDAMETITTKKLTIAAFVLLAAAAALAQACPLTASCPIHDGALGSYVGSRIVTGVIVGVYHCQRGHTFEERCK
jgi:hypothetical protein